MLVLTDLPHCYGCIPGKQHIVDYIKLMGISDYGEVTSRITLERVLKKIVLKVICGLSAK
jgi:hypothetical protein